MKKTIYGVLATGFALSTLWSCTGSDAVSNGITTIQVEKSFEAKDFDNISDKFEIVDIFQPQFTDSSMFSIPDVLAITDGKAYIHEDEWMAICAYPSGRLLTTFNHYGPGPEEYMKSSYVCYQPKVSEWTVFDNNLSNARIVQYDESGKFIRSVGNDSIQSITSINNGGWLGFNNTYRIDDGFHIIRDKKIYQYDSDWQLDYVYTLKERRWGVTGTQRMDKIFLYDDCNYVIDSDTIYQINTESHELKAKIALNLGKYGCDWGAFEDYEQIREAQKSHIYIQIPIFNSGYIFATYDIQSDDSLTVWYDVYRLSDGELVYRRRLPLVGDYSLCQFYEGIPVELDGETVYGWPLDIVQDDCFFVLIASDEMARIKDTDEANPTIVKIRIKS